MSASPPLRLSVVGHVNTGKTSLIATLARRADLPVSDGRTTLAVQDVTFEVGGRALLVLVDTPGFELVSEIDAELSAARDEARAAGRRPDDLDLLQAFLRKAREEGRPELLLDVRALEAALASDVILHVVDVTQEPLERLRDEVSLLTRTARPVVGVLNFTAEARTWEREWRDVLRREKVHSVVAFDVMVSDPESEAELYQVMEAVVPVERREAVRRLATSRAGERAERRRAALAAITDLLLDAATLRVTVPGEGAAAEAEARRLLQDAVRALEERGLGALARAHRFTGGEVRAAAAAPGAEIVDEDLFDPATWKRHAPGLLALAAGGAAAGAAVDALAGGASLGMGALIGGAVGVAAGIVRRAVRVRAQGDVATAQLAPAFAWVLLGRALSAHESYRRRTHARRDVETVGGEEAAVRRHPAAATVVRLLERAAADPRLAREGGADASPRRRAEVRQDLERELARLVG